MPKGTCSVPGCDRPKKSRGWCHSHYMRWYERGQIPDSPIRTWGRKDCSVEGCDREHDARGYCAPHRKRVDACGDPGPVEIKPRSVGDAADYALVHLRLKKRLGPARRRKCVACRGQALHWAYDHEDEDERTSDQGYAYSLNLDHYRPMCATCHKRFDVAHRNGTPIELIDMASR